MTVTDIDNRILALFEGAGTVETPTPGAKAWLARDTAFAGEPVLLKRVPPGIGKGRATAALSLRHPNVVRTRRWLAEGGTLYVVRDIVRGRNLRQSLSGIEATRLSAEALRRLLLPAVDALEYAHAQGVAHGGISPENILVCEDGTVRVSDFATADPLAPQHVRAYGGALTPAADVSALGKLIATFLPTSGAFAHPVVRGRIEGILGRCDTLGDLRETLNALERLAAAPAPRADENGGAARPAVKPVLAQPAVPVLRRPPAERPAGAFDTGPSGRLTWEQEAPTPRIAPGGGGVAALLLRNDGKGPVIVRMIATQHAWLNVRPLDLPMTIPPGGEARVSFVLSAARLSPGEYRSEVYLSANAPDGAFTGAAQKLSGGWFRHTAEVRIRVEGGIYR